MSLWIHLLCIASHCESEFLWNGELKTIQIGQLITGRKELSKQTGIPETTIERILKVLESGHQIRQQKTTKYRLITILNWDKYQVVDNKRTTNGQQTDTFKNVRMKEVTISDAYASARGDNLKDMTWGNKPDDFEERTVDLDGDGKAQVEKKPQTRKYPNAPAVRKIFQEVLGRNPAGWNQHKTQLQSCENLYTEWGLESVRKALQFYKESEGEKYLPIIQTPHDLDSKWLKLAAFKVKNN